MTPGTRGDNGVHVPGQGEVEEDLRPVRAGPSVPGRRGEHLGRDHVADGTRAGDHEVRLGKRAREVGVRPASPTDPHRETVGTVGGAVDDGEVVNARTLQGRSGQPAHRTGADEQHPALRHRAEDLDSEVQRPADQR